MGVSCLLLYEIRNTYCWAMKGDLIQMAIRKVTKHCTECGTDTLHIKHVLVKHPLGAVILCIMTFGFFAVIWGWNELWGRYICTQCDHT